MLAKRLFFVSVVAWDDDTLVGALRGESQGTGTVLAVLSAFLTIVAVICVKAAALWGVAVW